MASFSHALLSGDLPEGPEDRRVLGWRSIRREIVERDIFALGDYQDMGRGQRVDVVKGEDVLVLVDFIARDLAAKDSGEDIIAVVSQLPPPLKLFGQMFARPRFSSIPDLPSRRASSAATSAGEMPTSAHSTNR